MSISDTMHVKGMTDIGKVLQTFALKLERNVIRGGLRQGANVVKDQALANVPVSPPSDRNAERYGGYAGALRDSIRVSTRSRRGKVTASVKAGGMKTKGGADVYYANWVEYGTRPHMNGARGHHPGARPRPFMRPALDTEAQRAVIAVGNYMRNRLSTKHGIDTPEITIGDES